MIRTTAIIVAAGTGRRMNSSVKKQYMEISGHPVLYYTIKAFEESEIDNIVIVTGADEIEFVRNEIVDKYGFRKVINICVGGRERFDSVYEGVRSVSEEGSGIQHYVLIHDGVRMLVTAELINRCIKAVSEFNACVAAVPVKDTIKECEKNNAILTAKKTLDRSRLYQIQTPQCFELGLIKDAFEKMYRFPEEERPSITDDAMLVETFTDHKVVIVEGSYKNIKITTPEDLELAEFWLGR